MLEDALKLYEFTFADGESRSVEILYEEIYLDFQTKSLAEKSITKGFNLRV